MVINDVIAFYPKIAREAMTNYAQTQGIDWLFASNCMKQDGTVMRQLEQKERVIQEKEMAIRALETSLQEKENAIRELAEIVRTYSAVFSIPIIGTFLRLGNRARILLMPRLGNLNQYPPTPLAANRFATNTAVLPVTAPKISIVTPSYQQGKYIGRTIESVLSQGYPNLEYFVQDGLSSDESVDVIKSYANGITGWASEPDGGQSEAINRGLARSSGEIMAWLNSDDMLLPGTLAVVADFFARHPHVDVVYGNRLLIDVGDQEIGRWILPGHSNSVLSWVDFVPQETMFWRRRIWEKVGSRIDESYRFAMDWDLLLRFRDAGAQFAHIPKFLGAFRIHDRQKTSAQINQVGMQEMNRLRERVLGFVPADSVVRRHASLYMLRHVAVDLWHRMKLQWTCLQRG
jgi:glycosyltransferase involved in cell wall biosynthesis